MSLGGARPHRAITYQNKGLCSKGQREAEKSNVSGLIRGVFLEEGELPETVICQGPRQHQSTQLALHKPGCGASPLHSLPLRLPLASSKIILLFFLMTKLSC